MEQQHNGWQAWVNHQLAHHAMRLYHLEIFHAAQNRAPTTAVPPAEPGQSVWQELSSVLGALKTALQWLFALIVVIGIMAKRLTWADIPVIKSLVGG